MCGPSIGYIVIQVTDGLLEVCIHPTSLLVVHNRYFTNFHSIILGLDHINKELDLLRILDVIIHANIF